MTNQQRVKAPGADEITRRFCGPGVAIARPVILGGIGALGLVRGFRWTAEGAEKLLDIEGPLIFASNHCSHADTAAIHGTLPSAIRRKTAVAAALDVFGSADNGETRRLKRLKREALQFTVAAWFHAFAFDRHGQPLRSLRAATNLIRGGWNLLLYPEGTRSRTGQIGEFKSGVGVLAKMTGRPVIPVHVSGGAGILPCGQFLPGPGHAVVRYGEPLHRAAGESPADFIKRVEDTVRELGGRQTEPSVATAGLNGQAPRPEGKRLAY